MRVPFGLKGINLKEMNNLQRQHLNIYTLIDYPANLMKEKIHELEKEIESKDSIVEKITIFANEYKWEQILVEIYSIPFFKGKKLIKIYHFHLYPASKILHYLSNALDIVVLIFISYETSRKLDVKLLNYLKKNGRLENSPNPYKNQLSRLFLNKLKLYKWSYDEDLLEYLFLQLDGKEENIDTTIAKLAEYYPKNAFLEKEIVFYLLKRAFEISSFEFIDFFFEKRISLLLPYFLILPEDFSYTSLIFLMFRQIRLIYAYKKRSKAGSTDSEILEYLNILPFIFNKIKKQALYWPIHDLETLYQDLYQCSLDFKIYSGQIEKEFQKDIFQIYLLKNLPNAH